MATAVSTGRPPREARLSLNYAGWALLIAITAVTGILYAATLADLFNDWWTDTAYSQGLLIPPLAIWIAWLRKRITLAVPSQLDARGLYLTVGACLLFLLGKLGAEFFLARISFVVLLAGLIWTFWGLGRLRTLIFPILLLATMVPLPSIVYNSLAAPLQLFASDVATRLAQAFGVTVYRDGNIINLAHVTLGVERACSGLNSLSALIVGAILLGFLQCTRPITRTILFLLSIPISIFVNVVRVTGTAVLADYKEDLAMGFYHSFTGWLIFLMGFGALYLTTRALCWIFEREAQ